MFALSLQAWRGFLGNTWHLAKSYLQLQDLEKAQANILTQNQKMLKEIKRIQDNPDLVASSLASREFNLVQNPETEVVINFID